MIELNTLSNENNGPSAAAENFWKWFVSNEKRFIEALEDTQKAQEFLGELISRMKPFNPWLKALAGPYGDGRYELIITADGDIALFYKVEELVAAAPPLEGWIISAHKPYVGMDKLRTNMYGHEFSSDNVSFYPLIDADYPDEVNIVLVHPEYNEAEDKNFQTLGMIFLENTLGELNTATYIDQYSVAGIPEDAQGKVIPLIKLEDYLHWREKEFVEKYEKLEATKPAENFWVIESEDKGGLPVFAVVNTGYKDWEYKSAFPWLVQVDINYEGTEKGLPGNDDIDELQEIENLLLKFLLSADLCYIGHDTHNNQRSIYAYASDYKMVSQMIHQFLETTNWKYEIMFFIRKDKYWKNMEWFFSAKEPE